MTSSSSWLAPPQSLSLENDEVHVWRVFLDQERAKVASFFEILAEDERSRAERFYFRTDSERFIIARGILRTLIGRYLQLKPDQLRFDYNPYGKPFLAGHGAAELLCFNLSHSYEVALYAFTRAREIGLDVEQLRTGFASEQLARRVFSKAEVATLLSLPPHQQTEAFFNCWTRKEAYIKARGKGLSLSLHSFDVSFVRGEPAALLCVRDVGEESGRWSLQELTAATGYAAALAVEGHDWRLKCWRWIE